MLNDHDSMMLKEIARETLYSIERAMTRPSALYRPGLHKFCWPDERGTYWVVQYSGIEVRGDSPEQAMENFDTAWRAKC